MDAFDDLRHEHEAILRVAAVMRSLSKRVTAADTNADEDLDLLDTFLDGFVHRCHHRKEEQALFPKLAAKSQQIANGPVKVLTGEHGAGKVLMKQIADARRIGSATAAARALSTYATLLERHIGKENEIVFPLAHAVLATDQQEKLAEEFEAIEEELEEHQFHRRMEETVEILEAHARNATDAGRNRRPGMGGSA